MKKYHFVRFLVTYFIVKGISLNTGFSYNIFSEKLNLFKFSIDLAIWILVYSLVSLALSKFASMQKDMG